MTAPTLPVALRFHASREQFISSQHFEAWRVWMPLRRHLKRRKTFDQRERDLFFRHHGFKCVLCPSRTLITIDHRVPQILGGSSNDVNLRGLCGPCKRAAWKPLDAYLRAYDRWLAEIAA